MAAEEDIQAPESNSEPRSKTVPREAKARDRTRIHETQLVRIRLTSPHPGPARQP